MSNLFDSKIACGVVATAGALAVGTITKYGCDALGLSDRDFCNSLEDAPSDATLANLEKLEKELLSEVKKADEEQTAKVKEFEGKVKRLTEENAKLKKALEDISTKLGETVQLLHNSDNESKVKSETINNLKESLAEVKKERDFLREQLTALTSNNKKPAPESTNEQSTNPQPEQEQSAPENAEAQSQPSSTSQEDKEDRLLKVVVDAISSKEFVEERACTWTVHELTTVFDSTEHGGEEVYPALFSVNEKHTLVPTDDLIDLIAAHDKYAGENLEELKDLTNETVLFYAMLILRDKAKEFKTYAAKYLGVNDDLYDFWRTRWHEQVLLIANVYGYYICNIAFPELETANRNRVAQILHSSIMNGNPKKGQVKVLDKVIDAVVNPA